MTQPTAVSSSHPNRKYGRLPDDLSKPKLDLTELAATGDFSMVPATQENITAAIKARLQAEGLLGNDSAGDCEAVRWANHRMLMTGVYPIAFGKTTQDLVWEVYQTQNPAFDPHGDPSVNGPGSSADQGMSTDELLSYLHKNGGPDGVKVLAYGTIDPTNIQAIERAISLFGAVWVDILVQPGNQREFDQQQPWTNTGEEPEGGHAVLGAAYIPQRRVLTWADEATLADSFWSGKIGSYNLVQRVYLPIWPEHATTQFVASAGAQLLAQDYQALTGKQLVWPTSPTPEPAPQPTPPVPTPAPAPQPSGGGASFQVDDPAVVARVDRLASRKGVTPDQWVTTHFQHYFGIVDLVGADVVVDLGFDDDEIQYAPGTGSTEA